MSSRGVYNNIKLSLPIWKVLKHGSLPHIMNTNSWPGSPVGWGGFRVWNMASCSPGLVGYEAPTANNPSFLWTAFDKIGKYWILAVRRHSHSLATCRTTPSYYLVFAGISNNIFSVSLHAAFNYCNFPLRIDGWSVMVPYSFIAFLFPRHPVASTIPGLITYLLSKIIISTLCTISIMTPTRWRRCCLKAVCE